MTLEIAEDGEPSGLPYWLEITIHVGTVKVMPLLLTMCLVSRMHQIKPSIQRTVSVRVNHAIVLKDHDHKRLF
jgi:hypothetical protein